MILRRLNELDLPFLLEIRNDIKKKIAHLISFLLIFSGEGRLSKEEKRGKKISNG